MPPANLNHLPRDVSDRVVQLLEAAGKPITLMVSAMVYKVEFAGGRRLVINFNPHTGRIWLAGGSVASEFIFSGGRWLSQRDGRELFECLSRLIDEQSSHGGANAAAGKLTVIEQVQPTSRVTERKAEASKMPSVWLVPLILAAIAFIGFRYFSGSSPPASGQPPMASIDEAIRLPDAATASCEPSAPVNGAARSFLDTPGNPSSRTTVNISNRHSHDAAVFFTAPGSAMPLHSVWVKAGNSTAVNVPSRDYELMFSTGSVWCNLAVGYKAGQLTKLDSRLELKPQAPISLSLQSTGTKGGDFQVFLQKERKPGAEQRISAGVVELQQNADGHFYIEGSINGAPLTFLVDTGASITTLTREASLLVDTTDCRTGKSSTANGIVDVCVAAVPEMRIGPYTVNDSLAAVNANTEANLLGMNVLGQFQISTENGVMRLSKR
ncbi:MAG TPA: TIGR02281 family clan AA aspartic protease [Arenimonas sp.]|nr:TIGR02281 family clan AA aspartic protease [Arenimonas sp.]